MGADSTHNLLVVWKQQGLDQVTSSMTNFTKTTQTTAKAQDALGKSMDDTTKSVTKTGQEMTKTGKAAQTSGKQTQTLGQAFKSSSLMIAAFASSLVNTYQSIDSLMDQSMKLNRMRATLDKQTTTLQIAETNLKKKYDEGKISGESYRLQSEKLASQRAILAVKEEQYADAVQDNKVAWLSMATSVLPTVVTGFTSVSSIIGALKGTMDTASTSTNTLSTAKKALATAVGTVTSAFTPFRTAITNLLPNLKDTGTTLGAANSNNTVVGNMGALNTAFLDSEKSGNTFVNTFKTLGTAVKTFFTNIKDNMGNATGIIDKIKVGFSTFFTQLGSGFKSLGGLLKQAGLAVISFGKALLGAIIANPILLAIAAISAAVLALITNFGGFRDMINGIGVAIGNAIPGLKGFLDWFGAGANAALDGAAKLLGFETQTKKTGETAAATAIKFDPLLLALQKTIDLGDQFQNLDKIIQLFVNVRKEIVEVTDVMNYGSIKMVTGLEDVRTAFTAAVKTIVTASPQAQVAIQHVYDVIELLRKGNYDAATAHKWLTLAINAVSNAMGTQVEETKKEIVTQQKNTQATTATSDATSDLEMQLNDLNTALADETVELGKEGKAREDNIKKVEMWLNDMGMAKTATDTQKMALLANVDSLDLYGKNIAWAADGNINLAQTIMNLVTEHKSFEAEAKSIFGSYAKLVNDVGSKAIPYVTAMLEDLKNKHPEIGKIAEEMWKNYLSNTVDVAGQLYIVNEAEEEQKEKVKSTAEAVADKAKQLGIYNKIQDLSLQNQQNAIKITEDQTKAENTAILTLQKLAVARGMDISKIGQESQALFTFIATNNKVVVSQDEVYAKTAELIDARTQDTKNAEIDRQANEKLLQTMNKVPPVLGMTGKGLAQLVQNYDDIDHSLGIATDSVGLWWSELQKSQKIEQDERQVLLDFAEAHDVTIPDSIKNGSVPEIKAFIEEVLKIGPGAEKAKNELLKAFDEIKNGVKSLAEKQIDDLSKAFGESFKAGKKALKELGYSIDSLAAKKAMINVGINSEEAEDGIVSLKEMMVQTINSTEGELENIDFRSAAIAWREQMAEEFDKAPAEVQAVFDKILSFADTYGGQGGTQYGAALIAAISAATGQGIPEITKMFNQITGAGTAELQAKANEFFNAAQTGITSPTVAGLQQLGPGMSGAVDQSMQGALSQILGTGTQFQDAGQGLAESTAEGYTVGSVTFATAGEAAMYKLLQTYDSAGAEAYAKANGIATQTGAGLAAGAGAVTTGAQTGIVTPITSQVGTVPGAAGTALAPIEGIFSQAFIAASTAAGTQLSGIVTMVHTKMSSMSTSVATYSKSMGTNISTFVSTSSTKFGTLGTAITTAQGKLSNMSKSVSTYMSSMTSAVSKFGSAFSSTMKKVGSDADAAAKKVTALQKAIDSLKNKSITINVGLSGPGAAFIRHGGSGLNFPSESGVSYAAGGKTWLQKTPKTIGNTHVSEVFPEIITAIPLDPREKNSPFNKLNDLDLNIPVPMVAAAATGGGGGQAGGQGQQPIQVNGMLNATIVMPNGQVLAKAVQQFLLDGFSSVT